MSTVWDYWEMRCPVCGNDGELDIVASVYVRLTTDGTDADESENGNHEWNTESSASCGCGWEGKVSQLSSAEVQS